MKKLDLFVFRGRPKKATPPFPSFYCVDYVSSDLMLKKHGLRSKWMLYIYNREDLFSAFDNKSCSMIGRKLLKSYLAHPRKLDNLIKWSNSRKNSLRDFIINNLSVGVISKLDNKEIAKRYLEYVKVYRNFHLINTPSWWIAGEAAQRELIRLLKDKKIINIDEVVAVLVEPLEYASENFQEEMSLLRICHKIIDARIRKLDLGSKLPASVRRDFNKHIFEFSSIPFAYNTGIVWDEKYFIKEINKIISKRKSQKEIISSKLETVEERIKQRTDIIEKHRLPSKIIKISEIIRKLAYLQDIKKATQTKSHPHLQTVVFSEIAKRLRISAFDLGYITHLEIAKSLRIGKIDSKLRSEIIERQKRCVLSASDLKYSWMVGEEADEFLKVNGFGLENYKNIKEIKGSVGCKGYARGVVKICKSSTEIKKVKTGDILVTAMTTPDFVPAVKKAAATITDEGGIICHAAIISRELNKPCVVGTKIATKVLKDGMMVEVDANKGIVRIFK